MLLDITPRQRVILAADYLSRRDAGLQGFDITYSSPDNLILYHWFRPASNDSKILNGNPVYVEPDGTISHRDETLLNELTATVRDLESLLEKEKRATDLVSS
jgi:hypothetical protein